MGKCIVICFCGKIFGKFLVLGNLTCAQETQWLYVPVATWWTWTMYIIICSSNWITPNTAQASVDYRRVGRSMFCHAILITRIPWVHVCTHYTSVIFEVPTGNNTSDLEPKTFKKCSHKKNTSQCPWWEEEIKVSPGLKDLVLPWWIGVRIFDEGEICAVETAQSNNALLCIV